MTEPSTGSSVLSFRIFPSSCVCCAPIVWRLHKDVNAVNAIRLGSQGLLPPGHSQPDRLHEVVGAPVLVPHSRHSRLGIDMRMGSRQAGWWGIAFVVVLLAAGTMASVPTSKASTQTHPDRLRRPPVGGVVAQMLGHPGHSLFVCFAVAFARQRDARGRRGRQACGDGGQQHHLPAGEAAMSPGSLRPRPRQPRSGTTRPARAGSRPVPRVRRGGRAGRAVTACAAGKPWGKEIAVPVPRGPVVSAGCRDVAGAPPGAPALPGPAAAAWPPAGGGRKPA
jgi:hypothetical protein